MFYIVFSAFIQKICEIAGVEMKQVMKAKNIVMDKKPRAPKEKVIYRFIVIIKLTSHKLYLKFLMILNWALLILNRYKIAYK